MSFTTKGLNTEGKKYISKYITYGIQELKINDITIKVAGTGSKQVIFHVEGLPIKEDGFEGVDGANGPVGRITTMYMKPEKESEIAMTFGKIADSLGLRDKLDAIDVNTLEEYVETTCKLLKGKYANFVVADEQYWDEKNSKVRSSFRFPRYDFVEKKGTNPSKLKFDKSNSYHFKEAVIPSNIGTPSSPTAIKAEDDGDMLPF